MMAAAFAAAGCGASPLTGRTAGSAGAPGSGGGDQDRGQQVVGGATDAAADCDQLAAAHSLALSKALACTPGAPNQCQTLAEIVPLACPSYACAENYEYVNDGAEANALLKRWSQACVPSDPCPNGTLACLATAPRATCVPTTPGASTGTCMPSPSDGGAGVAPDGGESCDQLAADYRAAFRAALACVPGAPEQCLARVSPYLGACNDDCVTMTAANDATAVTAALRRWAAQCAPAAACPSVACTPPPGQTGGCVPVDGGGTSGICVNSTPSG
jgi:hypothetical protein